MPKERRVLVVEDDPVVQMLLDDVLSGEGYRVDRAGNGQEALDLLVQRCPDVILLDLMMPIMDGPTFLRVRHDRDTCTRIPVLILSAAPERLSGGDAISVGACGVVRKPFDLADCMDRVAALSRAAG